MKKLLNSTFLTLLILTGSLKAQEGREEELNFLEFYSQHADYLDKETPFAYSLESFAQYHQALLEVMVQYEKKYPYEATFPQEGSMTKLNSVRGTQDLMFLLFAEAVAQGNDGICFMEDGPVK